MQRILIIGDSGRGKTAFAHKLAKKLNLPLYSADDFYWKVKFSEKEDPVTRLRKMLDLYATNEWIIDGSFTGAYEPGFERADRIYYLHFSSFFLQLFALVRRFLTRKEGSFSNFLEHVRHNFYKYHKLGYKRNEKHLREKLEPYHEKLIVLKSYKEIDEVINNLSGKGPEILTN